MSLGLMEIKAGAPTPKKADQRTHPFSCFAYLANVVFI